MRLRGHPLHPLDPAGLRRPGKGSEGTRIATSPLPVSSCEEVGTMGDNISYMSVCRRNDRAAGIPFPRLRFFFRCLFPAVVSILRIDT